MSGIEALPFFVERVELAGPDGFQIHPGHAKDRTVMIIRKWLETSGSLWQARERTMTCLTARPGKGGAVVFEVMDPERFGGLQEAIAAYEDQLSGLEQAIRRLDALQKDAPVWFEELESTCGSLSGIESHEKRRLANVASVALTRKARSGKTPEEILKEDADYQKLLAITEKQIKQANEQLGVLRPKLEAMKSILESVGC